MRQEVIEIHVMNTKGNECVGPSDDNQVGISVSAAEIVTVFTIESALWIYKYDIIIETLWRGGTE